jgi:hypothetical protein
MRLLVASLFVCSIFAQPPQEGQKKAPYVPKNLQVLKVEPSEIRGIMRGYAAALGGKCDMCHIQGDFASDENHHKIIARHMIAMTAEINSKFPDGKIHVTCYTCHRGSHEPATEPPPAAN